MSAPTHDFYALLKLDPDVDDWAVIEKAIVERKAAWTRELGRRGDATAKQGLALVPEMQAALQDAAQRGAYRRLAIEQADRRRKTAEALLDDLLETLDGRGPLAEGDIENIARAIGPDVSKSAIAHAAAGKGLALVVGPPFRQGGPALQPTIAARIDKLLAAMHHADLYAFLDRSRNATPRALADRARDLRGENDKRKRNSDAYTNTNDLIGFCLAQFKDLAAKQRYDQYLADRCLKPLDAHVRLLGDRGPIEADAIAALIQRGIMLGATPAAAEHYVDRLIEQAKYRRASARPATGARPARVFCGGCGESAQWGDSIACGKCGRKLKQDCPSCQRPVYSMHAFCDRCGFDTGDGEAVDAQIASARAAWVACDLEKAEALLRAVLDRWPGHRRATEMVKDVAARRAEAVRAEIEFDELVRTRRLNQAEQLLLRTVGDFGATHLSTRRHHLQQLRTEAALLLARAREAARRRDHRNAIDLAEQALRIEADNRDAATLLVSLPVDRPEDVRLRRRAGAIELAWSTQPGIVYRITRRTGAGDAVVADKLDAAEWIDRAPPAGTTLAYAVQAVHGGKLSAPAHPAPVLLAVPATGFKAVAGDRCVELSWALPTEAIAAGLTIACEGTQTMRHRVNGNAFTHNALTNGAVYHYALTACFADPAGGEAEIESTPARARATPSRAPVQIPELAATRRGARIELRWPPPPRGRTEIRLAGTAAPFAPGTRLPSTELERLGVSVLLVEPAGGFAQIDLAASGKAIDSAVAHFIAVTIDGDSATVGAAAQVVIVDAATNVTSRATNQKIVVQWTWPDAGDLALIAVRLDAPPTGPHDPVAQRFETKQSNYRRDGSCDVPRMGEAAHHIGLWIGREGVSEYSEPVRLRENLGAFATIRYRVETSAFSSRRSIACIGPAGTVLTDVRIQGMALYPPASPEAGVEIARVPKLVLRNGKANIPIPSEFVESGMFIKMFCNDDDVALETLGEKAAQL